MASESCYRHSGERHRRARHKRVRGSAGNVGVYAESGSNMGAFASAAHGIWGRTMAGIGVLAQATAGGTVQARPYGLYAAAPAPEPVLGKAGGADDGMRSNVAYGRVEVGRVGG